MGRSPPRARPYGLRAVTRAERNAREKGAKPMRTRAKGVSVGPVTVIVAASSRLPGARGWRHKHKGGLFRRSLAGVPRAVTRAGRVVRQLERAGMMLGAVATGLELVRELRLADSNGTPSGGHSSQRSAARGSSQSPSGTPASRASRPGSSAGRTHSAPKSPSRSTKKRPANRTNTKKKTRGAGTTAKKRSRSRATKKAGSARTNAKTQARSRASAKRTRSSGRSRSSSRR
jgi:hypothetical protein